MALFSRSMQCLILWTKECSKRSTMSIGVQFATSRTMCSATMEASDQKPKRRGRKPKMKKQATASEIKNETSNPSQVQPLFPVEGLVEPTHSTCCNHGIPQSHNVERVDSNGQRHYVISCLEESYCFPSVTTVLEATQPPEMYFRLQNWRRGLVKEYGESKYNDIARSIKQSGTNFHKEIEKTLLKSSRGKVISIKPFINTKTTKKKIGTASPLKPYKPLRSTSIKIKSLAVSNNEQNFNSEELSVENEELLDHPEDHIDSSITDSTIKDVRKSESESTTERVSKQAGNNEYMYMKSVEHVLNDVSNVCAIESLVSHMELGYTGTFDCLAEYRGKLSVIDWKTSIKPKPTLSDCYTFPLQAAAYVGAINQDSNYPYQVMNALIVVVYPNGESAHAHFMSHDQLVLYWNEWLQRLEQYQTQFATDLSQLNI